MVHKGVDDVVINFNGVTHEVSGGICQVNLFSYVLICCVNHLIREKGGKQYQLKMLR